MRLMIRARRVSFASIDAEDESMAMAATFSQPATLQDYRNMMDTKGSQAKAQERNAKTSATSEKKAENDKPQGERPRKGQWTCGQRLDNGNPCGYRNFFYENGNRNDHTAKKRCDGCGKDKKVPPRNHAVTTLTEEFKKSQDSTNKALAALTEQMAAMAQPGTSSTPSGNASLAPR